jgi:hypothetical protein
VKRAPDVDRVAWGAAEMEFEDDIPLGHPLDRLRFFACDDHWLWPTRHDAWPMP